MAPRDCLPPVEAWPQRPLLLTMEEESGRAGGTRQRVVRANDPNEWAEIDSDDFQGRALFFVRLPPSSPAPSSPAADAYFRGRKRLAGVILVGRFKRRLSTNDFIVGNDWRPVNIPGRSQKSLMYVPRAPARPPRASLQCLAPWLTPLRLAAPPSFHAD